MDLFLAIVTLSLLVSSTNQVALNTARTSRDVNEAKVKNAVEPRGPSCPNALDIQPCVCSPTPDGTEIDLDCSLVEDETQLEAIFQATFPTIVFRRLTIFNNQNIHVLRDGTLGDVSFLEIWITQGVLTEVQPNVLSNRARYLIFNFNNISVFPFATLESFPELVSLDIRGNNIQGFPRLTSPTLITLYLSHNPLGELPVDAFTTTPSLIDLHLSSTGLKEILPGTFEPLSYLNNLGLGNNHLKTLEPGAIQCSSTVGLVDIGYNELTYVAPGAFPGLTNGWVYIHHNAITLLEEDVWSSVLQDPQAYFDPYGNPLHCGCDLAWVVRDGALMDKVDVYTTCADGRLLINLQATDFDHC